jgi:hypothetical protein
MITKLISDNAPRRTKLYIFSKMINIKILPSLNYTNRIITRAGAIRRCARKYKRFSRFDARDTFADCVSTSNSYKLTGLPLSLASSRMRDVEFIWKSLTDTFE